MSRSTLATPADTVTIATRVSSSTVTAAATRSPVVPPADIRGDRNSGDSNGTDVGTPFAHTPLYLGVRFVAVTAAAQSL
jgi:hypothetical protein